jgi:hypothetical protein
VEEQASYERILAPIGAEYLVLDVGTPWRAQR